MIAFEGRVTMIWIALLAALLGLGLLFRAVSVHVSPKLILICSVPVLLVLLGLQFLPATGSVSELPAAAESQEFKVDLEIPLQTLAGEEKKMADYDAELIFLNFWATWCGPCRAEMPSMARLYEELKSEGLHMVAVTDEDAETVETFLADSDYPFEVLLDPKGQLSRESRVIGLPTTLILDKNGQVLLNHIGAYAWDDADAVAKVRSLLKK